LNIDRQLLINTFQQFGILISQTQGRAIALWWWSWIWFSMHNWRCSYKATLIPNQHEKIWGC